jgi:Spy/CpxP family protein refolding chaperone
MATQSGLRSRPFAAVTTAATAAAVADSSAPATMQVLSVRATQVLVELEGMGQGVKVKGLSESLEAQRAKFEDVSQVLVQMEQRCAMERERRTWEA